jgi:N-acyl-D-aspartate/D-glutamate deacylase
MFQYVNDDRVDDPGQIAWLRHLSERGVPVTYSLAQLPYDPTRFRQALDDAAAHTAAGNRITPQVPPRPTGMLFGLRSSFHPFMAHPTYRTMWDLPLQELVAQLSTAEVRANLLAEEPQTKQKSAISLATAWHQMYRLGDPPDYEPPREASALATAEREGRTPREVVLDWLLEEEGNALLFSPLGSYVDHDHEAIKEMLEHPASVVGLGDGGAHCGLICDASFPTYLLTHWARDRTRGDRLPVELLVHKQTQATALAYGFHDRGVLAPGMLADVNVIDLDHLTLHAPHMVNDLPAGGRRLLQDVDGYQFTIKAGEIVSEGGVLTGARPGRTVVATDMGMVRR